MENSIGLFSHGGTGKVCPDDVVSIDPDTGIALVIAGDTISTPNPPNKWRSLATERAIERLERFPGYWRGRAAALWEIAVGLREPKEKIGTITLKSRFSETTLSFSGEEPRLIEADILETRANTYEGFAEKLLKGEL